MTIHSLDGGGAERVFSQLATRWAEAGHEVHVVTWSAVTSDPRPLHCDIIRHGLDVLRPNRHVWQALWAYRRRLGKLRDCLRQVQPELVLSFCDQMNISTLQATRGLELPVWIAERSDPARQKLSPWWEQRRRRSYPSCSGCIVQTEQIGEHLSRLVPRQRIVVIPNAVAVARTASDEAAASAADTPTAYEKPASVVLAVGRLAPEKGMDLLLRAWRSGQAQLGDWQLHIAGDGPLRQQLQQQAADLPAVHFRGWLADPAAAYASSQIFVLPSRYEGFPNALLEAMSYGLACIATQCSQAVDELAGEGKQAVLTIPAAIKPSEEAETVTALTSALIELVNSQSRRQAVGEAARQVSLAYTWNRIGPMWDRCLTVPTGPAALLRESGSPLRGPSR